MPNPEKSEKVTLFTTPPLNHPLAHRAADGSEQALPVFLVVEIASANTPLLRQTMYPDFEPATYWDLELPLKVARRFSDFFRRTLVRQTYPRYECHSLPRFLYGDGNSIQLGMSSANDVVLGLPVPAYATEAGRPYAMVNGKGANAHSVLGLGQLHPGYGVSILEGDGPLVVSTNAKTSEVFGSIEIRPQLYGEAGRLALRQVTELSGAISSMA